MMSCWFPKRRNLIQAVRSELFPQQSLVPRHSGFDGLTLLPSYYEIHQLTLFKLAFWKFVADSFNQSKPL